MSCNIGAIGVFEAARAFSRGEGTVFYLLAGGSPAILINYEDHYGFLYLHKAQRCAKFRGRTARQAIQNAVSAGRNVIFTNQKPQLELPMG